MAYKPSQQTINKRQHCKPPSITVTQTESDGDPSYSPSTAKEDEPWARPAGHMHASECDDDVATRSNSYFRSSMRRPPAVHEKY